MQQKLSESQIASFHDDGYLYPIDVLTSEEATELAQQFGAAIAKWGDDLAPMLKSKPHLVLRFANTLVHHPAILDSVESILGSSFQVWSSDFFDKAPDFTGFISWYQDATYMGLDPNDCVTAWIALSPSTKERGCVQCIPGSHKFGQFDHRDIVDPDNMLSRGQSVVVSDAGQARAAYMELEPGQMSLHHCMTLHASMPNCSDHRRLGFAIRFIPTNVRQTHIDCDGATLVRGTDKYGHFLPDPEPVEDMSEEAVAFWHTQNEKLAKVLFRDDGNDDRQAVD